MNYLKTFLPYLFGNKKGKSLEVSLPTPIPWQSLNFEELLMFHTLSNSLNSYIYSIDLSTLSKKDIFQLFNFLDLLNVELRADIEKRFRDLLREFREATATRGLTKSELQDLLDYKTDQLTVFAILKKDRRQQGVLVVRSPEGRFMTEKYKGVWSIPVLGLSGRGLPFHHSNGCTPTGVFTIDSVMPEANKNYDFGQFRRLIVNFIPQSMGESDLLRHLPQTHHQKSWWKPSVIAREMGRSLLRIHGSGRTNRNPFSPYYPIVPTSGCLATNEGSFLGLKKARDQRLLLDVLMEALKLPVTSANESKIHGLLYVVELDDNLTALHFLT